MSDAFRHLLRLIMQPRVLAWKTCLALVVLIHVLSLSILWRLEVNNAPELYFPASAPATQLENALRAEFPNDELLIALFSGGDLYAVPVLRAMHGLARTLERLPEVDRVFSVTTVEGIRGTADGFVVEPLLDMDLLEVGEAAGRLQRVLRDRFAPGWLATRDGQSVALIVRTHRLSESRERQRVEAAFQREVDAHGLRERLVAVAGTVALDVAQLRSLMNDSVRFTPLVMGLGLFLMYWIVGRAWPVAIGALAMSTVVVSTVGFIVALGQPYTLVSAMLPTLLSAYTVANILHLYASLQRMRDARFRRRRRVPFALQAVHRPALLNMLTTSAAMLALTLVPIPPIQVFGVAAAFGVLMIYLTVFYLMPGLLMHFDRGVWPAGRNGFSWARRLAYRLTLFSMRRAGWVCALVGVAGVLAVPLVLQVRAESDLLKFFSDTHPITVSTERFERALVGVTALELVVDGPGRDAFKQLEYLAQVRDVQDWVESLPEVDRSVSMVDIIEEMHWAFFEEEEAYRALPDDPELISQLLLVYDGVDLRELVNGEFDRTRILLNLNVHGANAIQAVIERIETHLAHRPMPGLVWQVAGYGRLFADQEDLLVQGQLRSLIGAFGQITVIMLLLWRSLPTTAISMLPNMAPLYCIFALMGASGIELDLATVLIASVVLGITVDDTIHIFHNYVERRRKGFGVVFSMARSARLTGRAVVATSVLLIAQFLILTGSDFQPTASFGLLAATGLLAGQLMDLMLLPALLVLWNKLPLRRRWLQV